MKNENLINKTKEAEEGYHIREFTDRDYARLEAIQKQIDPYDVLTLEEVDWFVRRYYYKDIMIT